MFGFYSNSNVQFIIMNPLERIFLKKFNEESEENKLYLIKSAATETVSRIAYLNKNFANFCMHSELNKEWVSRWNAYGIVLMEQQNLEKSMFFSHPSINSFELVLGACFFNMAISARDEINKDFLYSELCYLEIACQYGSVHALQRYNEYLYSCLESAESKEEIFKKLIENGYKMVPEYGAFGYMVLAEILSRYALFLLECGDDSKSKLYFKGTLKAINYADKVLDESKYSIHNASLGRGLKYSNSLKIDNPCEAKDIFIEKYNSIKNSISNTREFSIN